MTEVQVRGAFPVTTDREEWTTEEAVHVEAAGLVYTFPDYHERRGERVLAPRAVLARFMHTMERTGLDPLARQLYCIPRLGKGSVEWTIQTAIDGFRVIAERSRVYGGQTPVEWLTAEGEWVDVWVRSLHGKGLKDAHPLAAKVGVIRKDWDEPLYAVATWEEYVQTTSKGDTTSMWLQRGAGQLAKCAEALALRKAFPQDLSGVYTDDEMATATVLEVEEAPSSKPRSRVAQLKAKEPYEPMDDDAERAADAAESDSEAVEVLAPSPEEIVAPAGGGGQPAGILPDGPLCTNCGEREVKEEGDICGPCEDEILAAEQEAGS